MKRLEKEKSDNRNTVIQGKRSINYQSNIFKNLRFTKRKFPPNNNPLYREEIKENNNCLKESFYRIKMKKRINLTAHRLRDLENRSIHHKDSLSPYNPMLIIDSDKGNNGETARDFYMKLEEI